MNIKPDAGSPWGRRVWFEEHEFDDIMDELRAKAGSAVFVPGNGVDVDAVLEHHFEVVPDFVDLPAGLLGRTLFAADGRFALEISRALSEEAMHDRVARRRLRSTLAHECGHGALHAHLHVTDDQTLSLFPGAPVQRAPRVLCRQEVVEGSPASVQSRYSREWWEYQANRGMASLLLPRRLFTKQVGELLAARKHANVEAAVRDGEGEVVLRTLADVFDVNQRMIFYRFVDLGYLPANTDQERIALDV